MKSATRTAISFKAAMYLGVAALAVGMTSPAQAQAAEAKQVDIPAQSLADTLTQIGRQTGSEVVFQPADVRGHSAPAVRGALTADQALGAALQGSGLKARRTAQGAYVIEQDTASGNAATAAADDYRANEIVVTAQKRVESIQDVPIAMTALSQDDLTEQKIESGSDIMRAVPNLTFSKSNFTSYNVSIRGIGTKAISATTDPGVAVSFNNVGVIHNRFFEQEFFDMERLEVLRGPQGTLYGRNATGGVINLISAKPKLDRFEGNIKGEVGNYDSRRMSGMLNIPIVPDHFGLRIAGSLTDRDGYDYNSVTKNRVNGRDLYSLRATLGFENDWLRGNVVWERFRENDNRSRTGKQLCHRDDSPEMIGSTPTADTNYPGYDPGLYTPLRQGLFSTGCKAGSLYDDGAFGTPNGLSLPFIIGLGIVDDSFGYGATPDGQRAHVINYVDPYGGAMQSRNLREIASFNDPRYRAKSDILELNLDVDVVDGLTFSSQTMFNWDSVYSFQDYNRFNTFPLFGDSSGLVKSVTNNSPSPYRNLTPGGVFCDPQIGCSDTLGVFDISSATSKQFAQEFRLQSSFDGPFNFSVGGNYTKFKTQTDYYVMSNIFTLLAMLPPSNQTGDITTCGFTNFYLFSLHGAPTPIENSRCPYIDPNPVESINGQGHNYFRSSNPYKLESYAAFGEAYYNINPDLKLTAGLRYTHDEKSFTLVPSQLLTAPTATGLGLVNMGYPSTGVLEQKWGEFTGRIGLDWKPDLGFTDQTLLYAFYSRGYKAGGANPPTPGFAADPDELLERGIMTQADYNLFAASGFFPGFFPLGQLTGVNYGPTFEPEFVNAFEIGAKNALMGGRLILNASAFFYDYSNYQVSQIRDRTAVNENFDAKMWGGELSAIFEPVDRLRFNANVGYLGTRIGKGMKSIDPMNRTLGNPNYTVVKPWVQLPSNCVLPTPVVEGWLARDHALVNSWKLCGGIGGLFSNGLAINDPATGQAYDVANYPELNGGAGLYSDVSGNELPNSPHWTVNLGAEYTIPFNDGWSATVRGDGYWQAKSWARVYNLNPYDRLRDWTNFNISLRVDGPDDLSIEAYVKNVFNSTPITDAFLNSDDSGLTTNVFTLDPRIIGFSIAKKF
ncbi:TonB-dependent receptor domain-containing protein [Sphingopyxis sp. 550A]